MVKVKCRICNFSSFEYYKKEARILGVCYGCATRIMADLKDFSSYASTIIILANNGVVLY
jgi:hypothetical protein